MPAVTLRNSAASGPVGVTNRNIGVLSTGVLVTVLEDNGVLYLYTSADAVTWTLRNTINPAHVLSIYSISIAPNNNIGIAYKSTSGNGGIYYYLLTYATGTPTWTLGGEEALKTYTTSGNGTFLDIDFTLNSVPIVAVQENDPDAASGVRTTSVSFYVRKTNTNTWLRTNINMFPGVNIPNGIYGCMSLAVDRSQAATGNIPAIGISWSVGSSFPVFLPILFDSVTGAVTTQAGGLDNTIDSNITPGNLREYRVFFTGIPGTFDLIRHQGTTARVARYFVGNPLNTSVYLTSWTVSPSISIYVRTSIQYNRIGFGYTPGNLSLFYVEPENQTLYRITAKIDNAGKFTWYGVIKYWFPGLTTDSSYNAVWQVGTTTQANNGLNNPLFNNAPVTPTLTYHGAASLNHKFVVYLESPASVTVGIPAAGSTLSTDNPHLQAVGASANKGRRQGTLRMEFQLAKDAAFTTGVRTIREPVSEAKTLGYSAPVYWDYDVPAVNTLDTQGTWYARVRAIGEADSAGPWSAAVSFTVSHPPSAVPLGPLADTALLYDVTGPTFAWDYSDLSAASVQTAYEIVVERVSDGTVAVDTGKIVTPNHYGKAVIPAAYKDTLLRWKVSLWDDDDVQGPYSDYGTFYVSDYGVLTIVTPVPGGVSNSPSPLAAWTIVLSGGRVQTSYRLIITDNITDAVVYDSGTVAGNATTHQIEADGVILNDSSYHVTLMVTDNENLQTVQESDFTTDWVEPAAPAVTVDTSLFGTSGYNLVTWNNALADEQVISYRLYRRLTGASRWTLVSETPQDSGGNLFTAGDFEGGVTTDWAAGANTAIAVSATQAYAGVNSLRLTAAGAGTISGIYNPKTAIGGANRQLVGEGVSTSVRARLFGTAARNATLKVEWFDSVSNASMGVWTVVVPEVLNQWTSAVVSGVVPATASDFCYPVVTVSVAGAAAAEVHYIDNVVMFQYGNTSVRDYLAASNLSQEYAVVQYANTLAGALESVYVPQQVTPMSDDYWLIPRGVQDPNSSDYYADDPVSPPLRLTNVNAESFGEEYETNTLQIIGRGRKTDYGTRYGYSGQLEVKFYDDPNSTARAKRLTLELFKANEKTIYLRNPFGDIWMVDTGQVDISRIAGVGHAEFSGATIPYSEVS